MKSIERGRLSQRNKIEEEVFNLSSTSLIAVKMKAEPGTSALRCRDEKNTF